MKRRTWWNATALAYWLDRRWRTVRDHVRLWGEWMVSNDPEPVVHAFWLREGEDYQDGPATVWVNLPNCVANDPDAAEAYLARIEESMPKRVGA